MQGGRLNSQLDNRRSRNTILGLMAAAVLMVMAGAAGLLVYSWVSVDRLELQREVLLVRRMMDRTLARTTQDIKTAAIWDEAYRHSSGRPDLAWVDENFGDYFHRYFGHDVSQLSLPEASLLAGIINAPSRYDPYRNPKLATQRREIVLKRMHDQGYITGAQRDEALGTTVESLLIPQEERTAQSRYAAPHFVEEVKRFIRNDTHFGATPAERNDLLTNGGPGQSSELSTTYMYKTAFTSTNYGYASAISVFIVAECLLAVGLIFFLLRRRADA